MRQHSRVLIVQKDQMVGLELANLLMEIGVQEILIVSSYDNALNSINSSVKSGKRPDVVFLDSSARLETSQLVLTILSHENLSDIKIVLVQEKGANTGWAFQSGATRHLNKPFHTGELKILFRYFSCSRFEAA